MTSKKDRAQRVAEALERARGKTRDENRGYLQHDVAVALVKEARKDPELYDLYTWAFNLVKNDDEARRPEIDDQLTFFDPDAVIATGKGRRIELKYATRLDLALWRKILVDQNEAQNNAFAKQLKWLDANILELTSDTMTLGQLRGLSKVAVR